MRTTYANRQQMGHVLAALMPENRLIMRVCIATGLRVSDVLDRHETGKASYNKRVYSYSDKQSKR